jgi:ABC-type tungstate transport system permease subunit
MNRFTRNGILAMLMVLLGLVALPVRAEERLRMSTTTSTENSGLLTVLLPPFEKKNGCKVDVVSVGTGKALKLGEAGDVDVVFVHARALEDKFLASGFGVNRRDVMFNDFVVVGRRTTPRVSGRRKARRRRSGRYRLREARSSPVATNRGPIRRRRRSGRPPGSSPGAPGTSRRVRGWERS